MKYEETPPERSSCTRSEHHDTDDTEREHQSEQTFISHFTVNQNHPHSLPPLIWCFRCIVSLSVCLSESFIISIVVHVFIWLFSVSDTVKSLVMRRFHPAENLIYFTFIMSDAIDVLIESLCPYYQEEMIWPMSWIGLIRNHLRLAEESGWMCEYEFSIDSESVSFSRLKRFTEIRKRTH